MSQLTERPPILSITPSAVAQVRNLLSKREKPAACVRIGLKTKGCSGLSYILEYVDAYNGHDEIIRNDDLTIFIDPKAVMFLLGTTMDYIEEDLQSGFVFKNPNEKGRCGCGESFHV